MKKNSILICILVSILLFTACTNNGEQEFTESTTVTNTTTQREQEDFEESEESSTNTEEVIDLSLVKVEEFQDVRGFADEWREEEDYIFNANEYIKEDIYTYTFNEFTILEGSEDIMSELMEKGKNPGLGIKDIHSQGITGEGINVAIIDQNMLLNHPEFDGKVVAYYDTGCDSPEGTGSMHGPAVASLLVGDNIGVAPDANLYYAAAPSWLGDSQYYADALYWIIEENKKLPEDEKIRVVSVSAAPSGEGSPFTLNNESWDEAVLAAIEEGLLVLDCRDNPDTGFIAPAYFDLSDKENPEACFGGFPSNVHEYGMPKSVISVPTSFRTVAEEYNEGYPSFQYTGQGGLSWGIPYAAGVLALGWQINPDLTNDEIVDLLFETRAEGADGSMIINPKSFIEAVQNSII